MFKVTRYFIGILVCLHLTACGPALFVTKTGVKAGAGVTKAAVKTVF